MSNPLFIAIIIIGAILVFLQNRKKYSLHFYESLSIKQLYSELIGLINSIIELQINQSNYRFSGYENQTDFINSMNSLKKELKANNPASLIKLNRNFVFDGNFEQLARNNDWKAQYNKLYERFQLIFEAIEKVEN
jgi:hypothetical protein